MGAGNVTQAFESWGHLEHREFRLLVHMANTGLDSAAPPVYFRGWESAAKALGYDVFGNRDSARRNTMKALKSLRESGAIVSSDHARQGARAVYALTLWPDRTAVPTIVPDGSGRPVVTWELAARPDPRPSSRVTVRDTLRVTLRDTHQGDRQGPTRVTATDTPRSTEEPLKEYSKDESVQTQPPSPAPVDNSHAAEEISDEIYRAANDYLQARPDRMLSLMESARQQIGPSDSVRRQVLTAAALDGWTRKDSAA